MGIEIPFPATVRGRDVLGQAFEEHVLLDSLSAVSLSLRLKYPVIPGCKLFVAVKLSDHRARATGPWVAVRGVVSCVQVDTGAMYHLSITFTRHRFLYVKPA